MKFLLDQDVYVSTLRLLKELGHLGLHSRLIRTSAFLKKRSSPKGRLVRKCSRNFSKSGDSSLNKGMPGRSTLTNLAILLPIPEAKIQ